MAKGLTRAQWRHILENTQQPEHFLEIQKQLGKGLACLNAQVGVHRVAGKGGLMGVYLYYFVACYYWASNTEGGRHNNVTAYSRITTGRQQRKQDDWIQESAN